MFREGVDEWIVFPRRFYYDFFGVPFSPSYLGIRFISYNTLPSLFTSFPL